MASNDTILTIPPLLEPGVMDRVLGRTHGCMVILAPPLLVLSPFSTGSSSSRTPPPVFLRDSDGRKEVRRNYDFRHYNLGIS